MQCLVVEDDDVLARALCQALVDWGARASCASSLAEGTPRLADRPELLVFDIRLPDGSGVALAECAAKLRPSPLMIAISGKASGSEGFQLARFGVLGYLAKPFSLTDFTVTLERLLSQAPDVVPMLVSAVGRQPYQQILMRIRKAMVEQALALSRGNRTVAARLLGVTRQAVQHQIRDLEIELALSLDDEPS